MVLVPILSWRSSSCLTSSQFLITVTAVAVSLLLILAAEGLVVVLVQDAAVLAVATLAVDTAGLVPTEAVVAEEAVAVAVGAVAQTRLIDSRT